MAETKQSATQRIQVGLVGLIIVLLLVSLANMALDRASDEPSAAQAGLPHQAEDAAADAAPGEPLAELGVTPAAADEQKPAGAPDAAGANVRATRTAPRR